MPPAFILSQDQTLHEIPSCIPYNFLVSRQNWFGILFSLLMLMLRRHNLYPWAYYSPGVASQKYNTALCPLLSTPRPLIHLDWILSSKSNNLYWIEQLILGLGIIRFEPMTSTTSRWHSTAELYPLPCPYREKRLPNPTSKKSTRLFLKLKQGLLFTLLHSCILERGWSTSLYDDTILLLLFSSAHSDKM